jgi:predicted enzyme related to lactoylglutathione lyase
VVPAPRISLIEFPADDSDRALRFWAGVLGSEPEPRSATEGEGWVTRPASGDGGAALGVHRRGEGPGDTRALPYIEVDDIEATAAKVRELGGTVIHPGERWTICKDSEGSPFALAQTQSEASQ